MQTDASPWKLLQLIASEESVKLAQEIADEKKAAA